MAKESTPKVEKKYVETPLMKQYYDIKAVHPDAILLFRVGDFYETFGEDAIKASGILGITLTRRANGAASYVELAGFPHHSVETYLPKLVRAGERVAICEQLEDPKSVKGLVKRGVVELVTPGVVMERNALNAKENVYLAAVHFGSKTIGIAFLDISTGEFYCAEGSKGYIDKLISNLSPREILFSKSSETRFYETFGRKHYTYKLDEWLFSEKVNREKLCNQFGTKSLKGFGVEQMGSAISAAGAILSYIEFTEHKQIGHIASIGRIDEGEHVWIDRFTIRNLELFETSQYQRQGSFVNVIDKTITAMGGRLLRRWIALPLMDVKRLTARQDIVSTLTMDRELAENIEDQISRIGDLERIAGRVATQRVTPRELIQLKDSLGALEQLKRIFEDSGSNPLIAEASKINPLKELHKKLSTEIFPDPGSNSIIKGDIIATGVDLRLDDLRNIVIRGKGVLDMILENESKRTGIPSLKISVNNVYGYYIEVRNTHKDRVPEDWIRKQTLTSAERYITAELKEYEEKILGAEEKIAELEQALYNRLLEYVASHLQGIVRNAHIVSRLDVLQSFARTALERRYVRPSLNEGTTIDIKAGRHPVIEATLPIGEKYIPNDVLLNRDDQQVILITGPNMSGKSALLRQTALIILMSQIGSFVPAQSAEIGVVDKIFTRVGASDNISQGESTFMVEMLESASILNNISDRSVVFLDEIGRGTSTYDGISIAWAMVEYLHNHPTARAKTLFATHYHELNSLEESCERVKNYHVSVKEIDNTIVFVRKLERGGTEHSFGIHVARMAGMPQSVVARAGDIMTELEQAYGNHEITVESTPKTAPKGAKKTTTKRAKEESSSNIQLSMFQLDDPVLTEIRDQIKGLDINSLTPIEALNKLNEIKKISGL